MSEQVISNPHGKDTKSYIIFEKLAKGMTPKEVQKDLGYKNMSLIYDVNKKFNAIKANTPPPSSSDLGVGSGSQPPAQPSQPATAQIDNPEIARLSREMEALKELITPFVHGSPQSLEDSTRGKVVEGEMTEKRIYLTSKTLFLFDIAKRDGYPGDLSGYLNDMVSEVYDKRNVGVGLIAKTYV